FSTIMQITSWWYILLITYIFFKLLKRLPYFVLIIYGVFIRYLYVFIISLTTYQVTGKFWPYYLAGLPFDTYHAIGNAVFIALLYPLITYLLRNYAKHRFQLQQ